MEVLFAAMSDTRFTAPLSKKMLPPEVIARFHALASQHTKTKGGCLLWRGYPPNNYGTLSYKGKSYPAHRLAYVIHHGALPEGHFVCHRCDTPACVAKAHLFAGTHAANMQDAASKGKHSQPRPREVVPGQELVGVHTRLFADSIAALKEISAISGIPWQIELRLCVRRALRVALLKEK